MITYRKSLEILKKSKFKINNEIIRSENSLNRIASENVTSQSNNPSHDNAAFDGYVVNSKETNGLNLKKGRMFKILGTIAAGDKLKRKKIKKFQTYEIMTGGLIPKNFDTIIPIEKIIFYPNKKKPKYIYLDKKVKKFQHVRFEGSDYKKRDLIIKKGTIIKSNHILALKSLGVRNIKVKKIPNILFFSTGNEISNKEKIPDWKVRNSNSHYIKSISKNFLFNFID